MTPHEIAALTRDTTVIPTAGIPSPAQIAALARKVGVKFPADYETFLRDCGSLLISVHDDVWRRPDLGDVAPHWMQTRFELAVFGVCSEVEWLRIDVEAERFGQAGLVPVFAWANTRDRICFRPDGTLVEWSRGDETPLAETFQQVLERLIAEQQAYKDELPA